MIQELIAWAGERGDLLYLVTFLLVLGESALLLDLFVPGEVGLVLTSAALRAADGSLVAVIAVASAGAVVGDSISYWLGRRFGPDLVNRWRFTRRRLGPPLTRARERFERRGGAAVFAARWVGALRAVVPAVAGAAGMPYPRFVAWALPAAIMWATAVACAGWFLGDAVARTIDQLGWWISLVAVVLLAGWWLVARNRRRNETGAPPPSDQAADHSQQMSVHRSTGH
jgi:membrane protein DedA with SNARE-associated domain